MIKQPFLGGFSTKLFGSAKASLQSKILEEKKSIESCGHLQAVFGKILPASIFNSYQFVVGKRVRHYSLETTFWGFLSQILGANGSLAEAVACIQAWKKSQNLPEPSGATGAYCLARKALPMEMLDELHQQTQQHLNQASCEDSKWRGHVVKQIDGTSVQTADTEENQKEWPQPSEQKPGCGFPVANIVALLNWTSGAWEQWCVCSNKHNESKIAQDLLPGINKDDVVVVDRGFSSYLFMCQLVVRGAHMIGRLKGKVDWEEGRKLSGVNDRLFTFKKTYRPKNHFLDKEIWDELPDEFEVRIIKTDGRDRHGNHKPMYIISTLTDHIAYPADEIVGMYRVRWDIELRIRDVKTTMEMELLRTQSPDMIKRELMMFAIGFNLLRYLQVHGAAINQTCPTRISFKGVMDIVAAMPQTECKTTTEKDRKLLFDWVVEKVSERVIPDRPDRHEPRAKKRRPKSFQLLTSPRSEFKEIIHRSRYKKAENSTGVPS